MNRISASISSHGIERLLAPENLNPYYDSSLHTPDITDADRVKLCGYLPFYPIGTKLDGEDSSTFIPLGDHETKFKKHMGLLVSESKIVENMFVIEHLPYQSDTPLPTRILTTFGSNIQYPPIRGFVLQKNKRNSDLLLLVSEEGEQVKPQTRGRFRGVRFLSYLLLRSVSQSVLKNEARLKAEALVLRPNDLTKSLDSHEEQYIA